MDGVLDFFNAALNLRAVTGDLLLDLFNIQFFAHKVHDFGVPAVEKEGQSAMDLIQKVGPCVVRCHLALQDIQHINAVE